MIMAFLIGQGKHRPLIFSLLDTARFSNFGELMSQMGCKGVHFKLAFIPCRAA